MATIQERPEEDDDDNDDDDEPREIIDLDQNSNGLFTNNKTFV